MLERELKFSVHPAFTVPPFHPSSGVVDAEKLPVQTLRATYYDTTDLRLARNGVALRYRTGDEKDNGWHLKLPDRGDASVRHELHFEGNPRKIPDDARSLVTALARTEQLRAVSSLQTRRRRWVLRDAMGAELAEVADDEVSVLEERRVVARFRELELEIKVATKSEVEAIVETLHAAGATTAEPIPKVVRALGPQATAEPEPLSRPAPGPKDPASVAVQGALTDGVRRVLANDPPARLGLVEGVHQMRVGVRRLRSDLRTFGDLIDAGWAEGLANDLAWIADALGGVRDLDVLTARLHESSDDLEHDLDPLYVVLRGAKDAARTELQGALESDRFVALIERLVEAAEQPVFADGAARPCAEVLPPLVASRWTKLAKAARDLRADDHDELYHRVRIQAKKTRYAAEAVAPSLGAASKEAKRFASKVEAVQEVLGEHQDAVIARDTVLSMARQQSSDPTFFLAAGRLAERQQHAAEHARRRFRNAWDDLDRKKIRRWLQT